MRGEGSVGSHARKAGWAGVAAAGYGVRTCHVRWHRVSKIVKVNNAYDHLLVQTKKRTVWEAVIPEVAV